VGAENDRGVADATDRRRAGSRADTVRLR